MGGDAEVDQHLLQLPGDLRAEDTVSGIRDGGVRKQEINAEDHHLTRFDLGQWDWEEGHKKILRECQIPRSVLTSS